MAPQFVKPYVKTNKNDRADAEAICEAVSRPSMRFVPIKTVEQQDIQAIHRVRSRLVKHRTALGNEIRGLIGEYGIIVPQGLAKLRQRLPEIVEKETRLTERGKALFQELREELIELDQKIKAYDARIKTQFQQDERCRRLAAIPGIGPITATALVAAIGNAKVFQSARQLAAWLGLVPKHIGTGGKERLLGISKRGNSYLRGLLIHGARSVHRFGKRKDADANSFIAWMRQLEERRGTNRTVVATANKIARYAWAVLHNQEEYAPRCVLPRLADA